MKFDKFLLYLYLVSCFLTFLGYVAGNDGLMLFVRPIIFPSIYFYYLEKSKKISILFSLMLFCLYLVDLIILMKFDNEILLLKYPVIMAYSCLLFFASKEIDTKKINLKRVMLFLLIFVVFSAIMCWFLFTVVAFENTFFYTYFLIILLLILNFSVGFCNYYIDNSFSNAIFLIIVLCFLATDFFYALYYLIYKINVFAIISLITYMVAYYFVVYFFLIKDTNKHYR